MDFLKNSTAYATVARSAVPGPRHGEVSPRGESKSAAPPQQLKSASPLKPGVKAKSSLARRNYFITMHHKAGVNFENFTEVKFRDILLTGTGHRDRPLNRDSPGQTRTYGRSTARSLGIDL